MVTIRTGSTEDVERINAFYASQRRSQDAAADDFVLLLAENDAQEVVAVVRLCRDQGYLILRGMLIAPAFRRQGLGTQMLHALEPSMRGQDCYCIPYLHLEGFYGIVGFETLDDADLPEFFSERLAKYQKGLRDPEIQRLMQADLGVYPPDGLSFILMKRPAG